MFSGAPKINEKRRGDCGGCLPSAACAQDRARPLRPVETGFRGRGGGERARPAAGSGREGAAVSGAARLTAALGSPRPGPYPPPFPGRTGVLPPRVPDRAARGGRRVSGRGLRPSGRAAPPLPRVPLASHRGFSPFAAVADGTAAAFFSRPVTGPDKSSFGGCGGREGTQPFPKLPPLQGSPAPALPAGQDDLGAGLAPNPPPIFPTKPRFLAPLKGSPQT